MRTHTAVAAADTLESGRRLFAEFDVLEPARGTQLHSQTTRVVACSAQDCAPPAARLCAVVPLAPEVQGWFAWFGGVAIGPGLVAHARRAARLLAQRARRARSACRFPFESLRLCVYPSPVSAYKLQFRPPDARLRLAERKRALSSFGVRAHLPLYGHANVAARARVVLCGAGHSDAMARIASTLEADAARIHPRLDSWNKQSITTQV